jgi:hypothetical protein
MSSLHLPLLEKLKTFSRLDLSAGMRLFHGCRENSDYTKLNEKLLYGHRKWLSNSAEYAVYYAFENEKKDLGAHLLWVCELVVDVPSIKGDQESLISSSPWSSSFPWDFPRAYEDYAKVILPGEGARALNNHTKGNIHKEILLTKPEQTLKVVEVIKLPASFKEAKALAEKRFGC